MKVCNMKIKYTRSSLMFLIAYVLWVTVTLVKYTYIKNLLPPKLSMSDLILYTKYIVYILLLLKFWNDKLYRFQNFIGLVIVFCIGYIEYSVQDDTVLLFMLCIFIYSSTNVDFDDILKISLIIEVSVLAIAVTFSMSGLIPNNVWDGGTRFRYDLGFIYCTFGSHLMLFVTMVYSCIRKRITFFEMGILAAINIWLYLHNNTRIDLCIVIPFLLFFYVWTHFFDGVKQNLINKVLFQYSGVIIGLGAIIAQAFYNSEVVFCEKLDDLLTGRLYLGNNAIKEYGFTLFGQHIRWIGRGGIRKNPLLAYNYVDCSFLKYTLNYGVVFTLFLFVALVYIGKKAIEQGDKALCLSLLFLYIFAMVDAELCVLAFHPFLLKAGELLNPPLEDGYEKDRENYTFG